jgi:hypothetical protein
MRKKTRRFEISSSESSGTTDSDVDSDGSESEDSSEYRPHYRKREVFRRANLRKRRNRERHHQSPVNIIIRSCHDPAISNAVPESSRKTQYPQPSTVLPGLKVHRSHVDPQALMEADVPWQWDTVSR